MGDRVTFPPYVIFIRSGNELFHIDSRPIRVAITINPCIEDLDWSKKKSNLTQRSRFIRLPNFPLQRRTNVAILRSRKKARQLCSASKRTVLPVCQEMIARGSRRLEKYGLRRYMSYIERRIKQRHTYTTLRLSFYVSLYFELDKKGKNCKTTRITGDRRKGFDNEGIHGGAWRPNEST